LGTLIRTAAAFGFGLVITTAGSAETVASKTIRATMGAVFTTTIAGGLGAAEAVNWLKKSNYTVYDADINGRPLDFRATIADRPALIIGSEAFGADGAVRGAADVHVRVPMADTTESLNAAVAGAILMFWLSSSERNSP
jgi:TrmH family RNA methyltransferase